ncbi:MAG: alpha/beta fold hydrolase [Acidimicrobiia bacterium]
MTEYGYSSGDVAIYYQLHGEPTALTPLMLVHGGGSTITTNWGASLPVWAIDRRVIAVELQGHGHTAAAERPARFETSADDLAALLAELEVGPVDVLGFSNGGQVALHLAARHPSAVRRVIAASAPTKRDAMPREMWDAMAAGTLDDLPAAYRDGDLAATGGDEDHLRRMFEADREQMLNGFTDFSEAMLQSISAPVLVVAGDRDIMSMANVIWTAQTIPDARLLIVPGTHGDYLGELGAADGDLEAMHRTLPWLLAFLDG